jgi:hypothetical protein
VKLGLVDDDHEDDPECDHHEPHGTSYGCRVNAARRGLLQSVGKSRGAVADGVTSSLLR